MDILTIAEIIVSIILIVLILIQERSSGLSSVLGGASAGSPYQTRRGLERMIYWGTIGAAFLFVAIAVANLIL